MKLQCGNNSRVRSVRSCDEVETTGKARAKDEERFQKTKEEAWRLFERQPGFKRKTREEFEEELTRKVRNTLGNNREEREKMMQTFSSEMQSVVQPEERRHEARERKKMEQEDSNSQRQRTCEKKTVTEDSRPYAAPRTREMSSTWSSLHWSPQWSQPCARIRFGQCRGLHEPREHVVKMSVRCSTDRVFSPSLQGEAFEDRLVNRHDSEHWCLR